MFLNRQYHCENSGALLLGCNLVCTPRIRAQEQGIQVGENGVLVVWGLYTSAVLDEQRRTSALSSDNSFQLGTTIKAHTPRSRWEHDVSYEYYESQPLVMISQFKEGLSRH